MRVNRNRTPLAVAIPVHNEERRLPRLFDSLRAQTAVDVATLRRRIAVQIRRSDHRDGGA